MMEWKIIELGKVASVCSSKRIFAKEYALVGIPFFRSKEIGELSRGEKIKSELFISNNRYEEIKTKFGVPQTGDLLLTSVGSIGNTWIVDDRKFYYKDGNLTQIRSLDKLDIGYLQYFFKSKLFWSSLASNSTGTAYSALTITKIKKLKIPLPPLAEQKRIAKILDQADQLRQLNQQILAEYDALTKSLFLDMFGDPVANPMGWEKVKMGNLMEIVRGGSPRPINNYLGGDYPWIKIGDATQGDDVYLNKTKQHITKEGLRKTRLLPIGSLIFANCGVSLGFARIITFEGCIHDGWLAFSGFNKKKLNKIFLLKALNSVTRYFRETAPDGTQPNLNISIMKSYKMILPPVKLQLEFEQKLEKITIQNKKAKAALAASEDLFNNLLQKAFKGEL